MSMIETLFSAEEARLRKTMNQGSQRNHSDSSCVQGQPSQPRSGRNTEPLSWDQFRAALSIVTVH